jgi:O-antigen/teichoic acid export membrane protein
MLAKVFYLASRLAVPPLVLAHVTLAEYGLWSAAFVLIMYIGLTDVGFSNVYVRFVSRFHAQGDVAAINRLLSTGVFTLTLLAALVLLGLWAALPQVLDFLNVDAAHRGTAAILMFGAAGMFLVDLSLGAYCYLLHGLQRIRQEQTVAIIGYVLELVAIAGFLLAGLGVYSLLAAFVLRYTWSLTSFIRLAHRFIPELQVRLRHYDRAMLRHFFSFGVPIQISALLGTVLFSVDRVIAGALFGPQGIALFELGTKLPLAAVSVPAAISNVAMPAAARMSTLGDQAGVRRLYRSASRSISLLAGVPLGFMAVFAAPIAFAWLGPRDDLTSLPLILALTSLSAHLHIVTGPGSAVYRALGQVRNEFVYHGLRFTGLALGIGLAIGILGPSTTTLAIGVAAGNACADLMHNQRRMGLSPGLLFGEILLPGFAAYAVAAALLPAWNWLVPVNTPRWETLAGIMSFGLVYCAALGLLAWRWLLLPDERARLSGLIASTSGRILKWRNS